MAEQNVRELIERAINMEENSFNLYTSASRRVKDPGARTGLLEMAAEEKKHKEKLQKMLAGDLAWAVSVGRRAKVKDLQIGEALEAKPLTETSDLQEVLAFAIKREQQSGAFYAQMAALTDSGPARDTFEMLAKEEVRHKEYVESIFEQDIYQDF